MLVTWNMQVLFTKVSVSHAVGMSDFAGPQQNRWERCAYAQSEW